MGRFTEWVGKKLEERREKNQLKQEERERIQEENRKHRFEIQDLLDKFTINQFQKFWAHIYSDHKWAYDFDDPVASWDTMFYKKYKEQFLKGADSARNPDEDFATSFETFVLLEKPTISAVIDQEILLV